MKIRINIDLTSYESVSHSAEDKLIGGFSTSFASEQDKDDGRSNNCQGGNCKPTCGQGQNIQCNTTAGCGA